MANRVEHLAEGVSDRWVTIYALCQPIEKWKTGEVRYVGKTVGVVWHRVRAHAYAAKRATPRLPVQRWLKKQIEAEQPFHIRHLERVPPGGDWAGREKHWIAHFRSQGLPLLNLTDGGDGLCGRRIAGTEHASRIGDALKRGASFSCETCGSAFWRKPKDIKAGNNRFCSRDCYAASIRGRSRPVCAEATARGVAAAAAARLARTHCPNGHEFSEANTRLNKRGARVCRECTRISKAKYLAKLGGSDA